jgi:hypothetical protein
MQVTVSETGTGFAITIAGCTIPNLGNIVPAFFNAFPSSKLTLSRAVDGTYTIMIPSYPVPQLLSELISTLQAVQSVTT